VRKAFADFATNPFNYLEWYQKADCVIVMLHTGMILFPLSEKKKKDK
jgi:hypothetical protein